MKDSKWDYFWMGIGILLLVGLKPLIIIIALLAILMML